MNGNEIRQKFLDYFVGKGHRLVRSSPLLPANDPTLLFANAGMNQFKDVFLGTEKRDYTRAVSVQKCLRAGGKHNDLDDVGDKTHHTFFEMLGNFSFGNYYKREAIEYALDLLLNVYGMPMERLWFTVHESDDESIELWTEAGVPRERVLKFGDKTTSGRWATPVRVDQTARSTTTPARTRKTHSITAPNTSTRTAARPSRFGI
jgi:alanyl-tRNA synthetase